MRMLFRTAASFCWCLPAAPGAGMDFNATLFRRMAAAMKANGMLEAGYTLLSTGGSTYPHSAIPPWNSSNPKKDTFVIVRNSTGQCDQPRPWHPTGRACCARGCSLRTNAVRSMMTNE